MPARDCFSNNAAAAVAGRKIEILLTEAKIPMIVAVASTSGIVDR